MLFCRLSFRSRYLLLEVTKGLSCLPFEGDRGLLSGFLELYGWESWIGRRACSLLA